MLDVHSQLQKCEKLQLLLLRLNSISLRSSGANSGLLCLLQLKRTHFHDFMLDVHSQLKKYHSHQDPLVQVADAVARENKVLCLDEFFVNDVADAAILNRLFSRLWENGLVLVSTSNRAPDALYEGGLQRNLFLPFIEKLKVRCPGSIAHFVQCWSAPVTEHQTHCMKGACSRTCSCHHTKCQGRLDGFLHVSQQFT